MGKYSIHLPFNKIEQEAADVAARNAEQRALVPSGAGGLPGNVDSTLEAQAGQVPALRPSSDVTLHGEMPDQAPMRDVTDSSPTDSSPLSLNAPPEVPPVVGDAAQAPKSKLQQYKEFLDSKDAATAAKAGIGAAGAVTAYNMLNSDGDGGGQKPPTDSSAAPQPRQPAGDKDTTDQDFAALLKKYKAAQDAKKAQEDPDQADADDKDEPDQPEKPDEKKPDDAKQPLDLKALAANPIVQKLFNISGEDLGTVDNLKDAQNQRNKSVFASELARLSGAAGQAFQRQDPYLNRIAGITPGGNPADKLYDQDVAEANTRLQQFKDQVEQQKTDPNSPVSQAFREYAKNMGYDIKGDFSAATAEKVVPFMVKDFEAKQAQAAKSADLAEKLKERQDEYKYKGKELETIQGMKSADLQQKYAQLASDKEAARDAKTDKERGVAEEKLWKDAESFRGNSGAQQASKDILSAEKALKLVQDKDPNSLTTQDLRLLADEMGKIATGGVPGEHGVQGLLPNNLATKYAEMKNFLMSNPTDANAGEYIKKNMDYLKQMQDTAKNTVAQFRLNVGKGKKSKVSPEAWQDYLDTYGLNDLANPKAARSSSAGGAGPAPQASPIAAHPQDNEAVQWAKANPQNPKSALILRANGQ